MRERLDPRVELAQGSSLVVLCFELLSEEPGLEIGAHRVVVRGVLVHAVDATVDEVYEVLEIRERVMVYTD